MEKNFVKVRSIKDITISVVLAVAGCIMVALPTASSVNVAGFFLMFAGLLLFFILRTAYKDEATGVKYCKTERYFAQAERPELIRKIESDPNSIDLSGENNGNSVRLDIYYSKQSGKAYLQVFEYIPYNYEPCSRQIEHDIEAVGRLRK